MAYKTDLDKTNMNTELNIRLGRLIQDAYKENKISGTMELLRVCEKDILYLFGKGIQSHPVTVEQREERDNRPLNYHL